MTAVTNPAALLPLPESVGKPIVPPRDVCLALARMGLVQPGDFVQSYALAGGMSSEVWLIDVGGRRFCAKRALANLRVVADDWQAPVSRIAVEARWLRIVNERCPGYAPTFLGAHRQAALLATEWLPPQTHPSWRDRLMRGDRRFHLDIAIQVGERLARLHAVTAGDERLARMFDASEMFERIRIEPYFRATARKRPARAEAISRIAQTTLSTRKALIHGDVLPKNILLGPDGPVFLDAEWAWYGDPAFDLAFCLNYLLLKSVSRAERMPKLLANYDAVAAAYLRGVTWEPADDLERRAAHLVPALLLARGDANPDEIANRRIDICRAMLMSPLDRLNEVRAVWQVAFAG